MAKKTQGSSDSVENANVVNLSRCASESCNRRTERDSFCLEHFDWFKAGLITKKGIKAKDFDKKYRQFLMKKAS